MNGYDFSKGGKDELASVGWDGLIDDVRIYDRALTDGEILWLSGETEPRPKPFWTHYKR